MAFICFCGVSLAAPFDFSKLLKWSGPKIDENLPYLNLSSTIHEKVERLQRKEGLQLPQRYKKHKRLFHKDAPVIRLRPKYQNPI